MSSLSWATRFGLSDRELSELQNHLNASGEDALRWVLVNGHLDEREYLQWAMDTYELPVVKNEFFQIAPDTVFWEAVRSGFAWTPAFIPLAEWNGVLLIGCLEPPRFHFPLRSPHRFVLASAKELQARYQAYNPEFSSVESANDDAAVDLGDAQVEAHAEARQEVRQRPMDEYLADSLPPAPDVSLENPDGLTHEIPPASTPNLFVVPDGMPTDDIGQPISSLPDGFADGTAVMDLSSFDENSEFPKSSEVKPEVTAPIEAVAVVAQAAPVAPAQTPAQPAPVAKPSSVELKPWKPTQAPGVELASRPYVEPSQTASAAKAPPAVPPSAIASAASSPSLRPAPAAEAANVTPIAAAHTSIVPNTAQALPLETCANYEALGTAAIGHILKNFEQGLVLMFQGGKLKPWKWTEQLLSVKGDAPDAIPLEQASIFRIAYKTCMPYHGYVVPNAVNTAFFNAFNRGLAPKHVTIVPVLINGDLVGMLMGLSMDQVDYKTSLMAMEKLASEFGRNLDRVRGRAAA